ncbi:TetR/AcrR family transcriptional regulator [Candidatus Gracilibacteria bacterium]|nr:TetR/AcrR family transcriptional regulator [Candidatus Gracilibacteria bacterium]
MSEAPLSAERILVAAEDVLRRYGPTKATVVDVARVLGVSHGSVYRHFPSKAALRDAVAERWLARIVAPLERIVVEDGSAAARLRRWLELLTSTKRQLALEDPTLFAAYVTLAAESRAVIQAHVAHLVDHAATIIGAGVAQGEFAVDDVPMAARAVFDATARFHDPAHVAQWADPGIDAAFEGVWALLQRGLEAR